MLEIEMEFFIDYIYAGTQVFLAQTGILAAYPEYFLPKAYYLKNCLFPRNYFDSLKRRSSFYTLIMLQKRSIKHTRSRCTDLECEDSLFPKQFTNYSVF